MTHALSLQNFICFIRKKTGSSNQRYCFRITVNLCLTAKMVITHRSEADPESGARDVEHCLLLHTLSSLGEKNHSVCEEACTAASRKETLFSMRCNSSGRDDAGCCHTMPRGAVTSLPTIGLKSEYRICIAPAKKQRSAGNRSHHVVWPITNFKIYRRSLDATGALQAFTSYLAATKGFSENHHARRVLGVQRILHMIEIDGQSLLSGEIIGSPAISLALFLTGNHRSILRSPLLDTSYQWSAALVEGFSDLVAWHQALACGSCISQQRIPAWWQLLKMQLSIPYWVRLRTDLRTSGDDHGHRADASEQVPSSNDSMSDTATNTISDSPARATVVLMSAQSPSHDATSLVNDRYDDGKATEKTNRKKLRSAYV